LAQMLVLPSPDPAFQTAVLHLQGLSKHQASSLVAIFVFVFLDHAVLSVDSIEVAWELLNGLVKHMFILPQPLSLFLMACATLNFSSVNTATWAASVV
jgi:hypothetical protein